MPPTIHYKLRVLRDVFRNLVIPCVVTASILHQSRHRCLDFPSTLLYLAAIAISFLIRVKYTDFMDEREARKLKARLVPRWDKEHRSRV